MDTGAGFLALDGELSFWLGITDSASESRGIDLAERALPRLRIGRLEMDQLAPVLTIDADIVRRVSDRPVLGLLGQKPIATRALWIDYAMETLALIPIDAGARPGSSGARAESLAPAVGRLEESRKALAGVLGARAVGVPFDLAGDGKILVSARVSDPAPPRFSRPLTLILDTGATKCVLFEDSLAEIAPRARDWPALYGLSAPTLIGTSHTRIAMAPAIELDRGPRGAAVRCDRMDFAVLRSELSDALSRVVGRTVHGLLGASFLRRYRVTIDYPHRVLWLEPPSGHRGERPWEYSHVGLQIERWEGALRVVAVATGTPAARAGIKVGDELVSIDGRPLERLDLPSVVKRLEGPPGSRISLTLRRGETRRSYALVRRRLL